MAKWQPPHPDPLKMPTPRRQKPFMQGPTLPTVKPGDLCVWGSCWRERSEMEVQDWRGTRRFELCDVHIEDTINAAYANHHDTNQRVSRGEIARRGDQATGWIYYAKIGDSIKIGYTTDLPRRMYSYPPDTLLLAIEPGTKATERGRHSLFSAHLAHGREWFKPHPDIDEWIAKVLAIHGQPSYEGGYRQQPQEPDAPIVGGKRSSRKW